MKKITFVLAALLITVASFAIVNPKYTASFSSRVEMRKFIKKTGGKILAAGEFKYLDVKVIPISENTVSIEISGTNTMPHPNWDACGGVYYGASTNNTMLYYQADAAYGAYEAAGYNCICMVESTNTIYGEFTGHQTCISIQASITTACPCLM